MFIFASATTVLLSHMRKNSLGDDVNMTVQKGIYTEQYLKILNFEWGFENGLGLVASAYACRFAIATPLSFVNTVVIMVKNTLGLTLFLYRRVVLKAALHGFYKKPEGDYRNPAQDSDVESKLIGSDIGSD